MTATQPPIAEGAGPSPTCGAAAHPRPLPPKWVLLAAFWIVQALLVYVAGALWLTLMGSTLSSFRANIANIDWVVDGLADSGLLIVMGTYVAVLTGLQAVLLLPVRKPRVIRERGTSLWLSIALAGLAIAALWTAAVLAAMSLYYLGLRGQPEWIDSFIDGVGGGSWIMFVPLALGWLVATPLLLAFSRGRRRETLLARIATRILLGTVVEVVAIIPLAVMVRRRTECCCDTGTFWALTLCGTVGVVLAGPAAIYVVLGRRRRRWYADKCEACGYDMGGLLNADRCPECGCGWASAPAPGPGGQS